MLRLVSSRCLRRMPASIVWGQNISSFKRSVRHLQRLSAVRAAHVVSSRNCSAHAVTEEQDLADCVSHQHESVRNSPGIDALCDILDKFSASNLLHQEAETLGLADSVFPPIFKKFRSNIISGEWTKLATPLRDCLVDISSVSAPIENLLPRFREFAYKTDSIVRCVVDLRQLSDLRSPTQWYPQARSIKRRIIYHAGPTNSGKTHAALQRFKEAKQGLYCGPLRLLALEVYDRTNADGIPCDLLTGDLRLSASGHEHAAHHRSCTVEMASCSEPYDVAVIDEIQMIQSEDRGHAWTRAILGLAAEEIHVCGEATAIDLVRRLVKLTGDELEVVRYKRLSPLTIRDAVLTSWTELQPGDCVVAFSRLTLLDIRHAIETSTNYKCAVIYGRLPAATRVFQAHQFNDPDSGVDILVSTDAIGMGLNLYGLKNPIFKPHSLSCSTISLPRYLLMITSSISFIKMFSKCFQAVASIFRSHYRNIGRIIFTTMRKFDGSEAKLLTPSQCKQIAGRAGRYNSRFPNGEVAVGRMYRRMNPYVEKVDSADTLKQLFGAELSPIKAAGIGPSIEQMEMFSHRLPSAPFSHLLSLFNRTAQVDTGLYFLCDTQDQEVIAEEIDNLPLTIRQKCILSLAPLSISSKSMEVDRKRITMLKYFTRIVTIFARRNVVGEKQLKRVLEWPPRENMPLEYLEDVHRVLDVYKWLGFRFEGSFPAMEEADRMQKVLEDRIAHSLVAWREKEKGVHREDGQTVAFKGKAFGKEVEDLEALLSNQNAAKKLLQKMRSRRQDAGLSEEMPALHLPGHNVRLSMAEVNDIVETHDYNRVGQRAAEQAAKKATKKKSKSRSQIDLFKQTAHRLAQLEQEQRRRDFQANKKRRTSKPFIIN